MCLARWEGALDLGGSARSGRFYNLSDPARVPCGCRSTARTRSHPCRRSSWMRSPSTSSSAYRGKRPNTTASVFSQQASLHMEHYGHGGRTSPEGESMGGASPRVEPEFLGHLVCGHLHDQQDTPRAGSVRERGSWISREIGPASRGSWRLVRSFPFQGSPGSSATISFRTRSIPASMSNVAPGGKRTGMSSAAAASLAALGADASEALPALKKASNDPREYVRNAVLNAFNRIEEAQRRQ